MQESTSNATTQSTNFIVTLEEDPNPPHDLLMPIPDELFDILGWEVGDTLDWCVEDGKIILKKVN